MRVTVCELPDARFDFARSWPTLVEHVAAERSELVLLPAMPFAKWFAGAHSVDPDAWNRALEEHDAWEPRLKDLAPAMVAGTRPMNFGNERYEEGFVWTMEQGFRGVHANAAPRSCPGYWEANWYHGAVPDFIPQEINGIAMGFLLDDELYWAEEADLYGAEGVQLLLAPRCTDGDGKWLTVSERAADAAHAYQLSSNRVSFGRRFGGTGWIINPQGVVLGMTSKHCPFLTLDVDLLSGLTERGATRAEQSWRQLGNGQHRS